MDTFNDLKNKAEALRKEGEYNDAISVYKEILKTHPDNFDNFVYWGYAFCLRKVGKIKVAFIIAQRNYLNQIKQENYLKNKTYQINASLYAWCHYDLFIKSENLDNNKIFWKAANKIVNITKQDKFSPFTKTVLNVLKRLNKNKMSDNSAEIISWLSRLNPKELSSEAKPYQNKVGKTIKPASDKEKYYWYKVKALFKQKKYKETIELCEYVLKNNISAVYTIWFKKNIAESYFNMGKYEEALPLYKTLLNEKNEWFFQQKLFEISLKQGVKETAIKYAVDACLNAGDESMKGGLYQKMAMFFDKEGKNNEAKKLIEYVYILREEKEWKIDDNLLQQIKYYGIDINNLESKSNIWAQLLPIWEDLKYSDQPLLSGRIKSILPNGISGFIESKDRNDYFFIFKSFIGAKNLLKIGQTVTFYLQDSFDKKKNKASKEAINIKIIN